MTGSSTSAIVFFGGVLSSAAAWGFKIVKPTVDAFDLAFRTGNAAFTVIGSSYTIVQQGR